MVHRRNIKACLKVLNECRENIPRFVSHYLDEMPPVGFGNMDTSALLSRVEQLSQEVSSLRRALGTQAEVTESMGAIITTMDRRVSAYIGLRPGDCRPATHERWCRG